MRGPGRFRAHILMRSSVGRFEKRGKVLKSMIQLKSGDILLQSRVVILVPIDVDNEARATIKRLVKGVDWERYNVYGEKGPSSTLTEWSGHYPLNGGTRIQVHLHHIPNLQILCQTSGLSLQHCQRLTEEASAIAVFPYLKNLATMLFLESYEKNPLESGILTEESFTAPSRCLSASAGRKQASEGKAASDAENQECHGASSDTGLY